MAYGWRVIPNFPLYEISPKGVVKQIRDGRVLTTSYNNRGYHYHLESKNGQVMAMKQADLIELVFPKE